MKKQASFKHLVLGAGSPTKLSPEAWARLIGNDKTTIDCSTLRPVGKPLGAPMSFDMALVP